MPAQRLTERTTFERGRIGGTPEAPVIEGVLLCGPVSANRRRYLKKAFEGDRIKLYDKVPVGTYHTDKQTGHQYLEQLGLIRNPRHRADGMPVGDIHVNPKKPGAEAFLWDAQHQPDACGMSHVAHCETAKAGDGWEDVNAIVRVESVDVIGAGGAATTKGLFRSEAKGTAVKISLKQFVERCGPKWGPAKWAAATKLAEDLGDMADAPVVDEPAADAPEGDLKASLMAALTPLLDEAFESGNSEKACSALRDFIKLHAKHTGKAAPKDAPPDDAAAEESKRRGQQPDPFAILAECERDGYRPTAVEVRVLSHMTADERKAFVTEQKKKVADARVEKPQSAGRAAGGGEAGGRKVEAKRITWDD